MLKFESPTVKIGYKHVLIKARISLQSKYFFQVPAQTYRPGPRPGTQIIRPAQPSLFTSSISNKSKRKGNNFTEPSELLRICLD
jgi:hypothetical protein